MSIVLRNSLRRSHLGPPKSDPGHGTPIPNSSVAGIRELMSIYRKPSYRYRFFSKIHVNQLQLKAAGVQTGLEPKVTDMG